MEGSIAHSFLASSAEVDDMADSVEGGERRACWGFVGGLDDLSMVAPKVTGSCFSFVAIVTSTGDVSIANV